MHTLEDIDGFHYHYLLLQPNGRFETQTKICLSISQHHPEHWQPSWSGMYLMVGLCLKFLLFGPIDKEYHNHLKAVAVYIELVL